MNQLNAFDASIYTLNSEDHNDSICLGAHVRRELEVMVGPNSAMSNNFIACIKYAAANSISIIVFDEDAPIPICLSIEGNEYCFSQDDGHQFDAKENV